MKSNLGENLFILLYQIWEKIYIFYYIQFRRKFIYFIISNLGDNLYQMCATAVDNRNFVGD